MSGQKETNTGTKKNPKTSYAKTNVTSTTTNLSSKTTTAAIPSTPRVDSSKAHKEPTKDEDEDNEDVKEVDETKSDDKNIMKFLQEIYSTMKKLNDKIDQNAEDLEEVRKKMIEDEAVKEETLNAIIQSQIQNIQSKNSVTNEEQNSLEDESYEEDDSEELEDNRVNRNDKKKIKDDLPVHSDNLKVSLPGVRRFNFEDDLLRRVSILDFEQRESTMMVTSDVRPDFQWSNGTIDGFLKFLDEVDQFELKYDRKVKYLFPLIEKSLQRKISD